MLAREVMLQCHDYECARDKLAQKKLIAGGYYILVGRGAESGVIITRDRSRVVDYTEIRRGPFIL